MRGGNIQTGYRCRDHYAGYIANICGANLKDKKYAELIGKLTITEMKYLIILIEEAQARAVDEIKLV